MFTKKANRKGGTYYACVRCEHKDPIGIPQNKGGRDFVSVGHTFNAADYGKTPLQAVRNLMKTIRQYNDTL